jgi:hypothetical protein
VAKKPLSPAARRGKECRKRNSLGQRDSRSCLLRIQGRRTSQMKLPPLRLARARVSNVLSERSCADGWLAQAHTLSAARGDLPVRGWILLARSEGSTDVLDAVVSCGSALEAAREVEDPDLETGVSVSDVRKWSGSPGTRTLNLRIKSLRSCDLRFRSKTASDQAL